MTSQSTHAYEFLAHTGSAAIANTCICVLAGEAGDVQNKECLARRGQPRKHCSASLHHITARFENRVLSILWWVDYRMKPPQVYHCIASSCWRQTTVCHRYMGYNPRDAPRPVTHAIILTQVGSLRTASTCQQAVQARIALAKQHLAKEHVFTYAPSQCLFVVRGACRFVCIN